MITIPVDVKPRPYDTLIENGLLTKAGSLLRELLPAASRLFVITVAPVRRKWGKTLLASLSAAGFDAKLIEMPEGERFKRLATVETLAEKLTALGADRNSVVLAFGGGVAGDVGGLVASLYMRGIDFVQIPTTVLAQVDASVGGKTGVNLKAGKNLVGTFHQPRVVLIDPQVLSSLPQREYRAGLYEALKCGVIGNAQLFGEFEKNRDAILKRDAVTLERLIAESVRLKAHVEANNSMDAPAIRCRLSKPIASVWQRANWGSCPSLRYGPEILRAGCSRIKRRVMAKCILFCPRKLGRWKW